MKQTKRQFPLFSFYDRTGMEKRLEAMAQKGWLLESISPFGWRYRAIPPQTLRFSVSFLPLTSPFAPEPTPAQEAFQELTRHDGWTLAASNEYYHVFYHQDPQPTPIETDPLLEREAIHRAARKRVLPFYFFLLVLSFLFGGSFCYTLLTHPWDLWAQPQDFLTGSCFLALFLYLAVDLLGYYQWRKKALLAGEAGEFLPTKGHNTVLLCLLFYAVGSFLFWLVLLATPGLRYYTLAYLVSYLVIVGVAYGVRALMKRCRVAAGANLTLTMLLIVLVSFGMTSLLLFLLTHLNQQGIAF